MKKISIYIVCLIGLIGMQACKKPDPLTENAIKVSVAFDEVLSSSDQKLFIDGSDASISWTTSDKIKLVNATTPFLLTYSQTANAKIAYFTPNATLTNGLYIGVHPTSATVNFATNKITYTAPSAYTIDPAAPNAYITANLLMYTPTKYNHGTSPMANFTPAMTILEIPLKTDSGTYQITSITLTAVGPSPNWNSAFMTKGTLTGTSLTLDQNYTKNTISYNFTGNGLSVGTTLTTIKLLVWSNPATTGLTSYKVAINANDVVKTKTKTTPFLNSKYYKFSAITISDSVVKPHVGGSYGGGYVFHIFTSGQPGYVAGETHGLIVAAANLSSTFVWGCYGTSITTQPGIGYGITNTAAIIGLSACFGAAHACDSCTIGGYTDWFLPSLDELTALRTVSRSWPGNFTFTTPQIYWSSTGKNIGGTVLEAHAAEFSSWSNVTQLVSRDVPSGVIPVRQF